MAKIVVVSFSRTKRFKDSFLISSINLWNNLPESVRSSPSLDCFKNKVVRHFNAQLVILCITSVIVYRLFFIPILDCQTVRYIMICF